MLDTPKLGAVLHVWASQKRVEDKNDLPGPLDHAAFDGTQDTIIFVGYKLTFLAHSLSSNTPKVLFSRHLS